MLNSQPPAPSDRRDLHVPDRPELLPYLPMLYVAWADGDLEPAEIRAICSRAEMTEGMDEKCQQFLKGWLDPENPPSARDLTTLLASITPSDVSTVNPRRPAFRSTLLTSTPVRMGALIISA